MDSEPSTIRWPKSATHKYILKHTNIFQNCGISTIYMSGGLLHRL